MRRACFFGMLWGTLGLACSDSETIVSLNVCTLASVDAEAIDSLGVRIQGAASETRNLEDVSILPCGTKPTYFNRIRLGDDVEKGTAEIEVTARSAGATLETGTTTVTVRSGEVVAAFVELGTDEVPGSGGAGGAGGAAGAPGAAGSQD